MVNNRIIKFRVTKQQYERILNNKDNYGYVTLSNYLRYLALEKNILIDTKIVENNRLIKEILEIIKNEKSGK